MIFYSRISLISKAILMSKSTRGNSLPVWKSMLIGSAGLCMFLAGGANAQMGFGLEFTPREPNSFARLEPREVLKNVIVGIETPASSGTGTIIGKKGNVYTILTAQHVIPSIKEGDEYYAYSMKSKKRYRITSVEAPLGKKADIAVATFTAPEDLNLNIISYLYTNTRGIGFPARSGVMEQWKMDSTGGRGAGISMPSGAVTVPIYRFTEFIIQERAYGNKDGYELLYAASTVPGMSGGPIAGYRDLCNGSGVALLAIHGRSEKYHSGGRSGLSLGVPVDLIKDYLADNSERLGIPVTQEEIQKTINSQYCS